MGEKKSQFYLYSDTSGIVCHSGHQQILTLHFLSLGQSLLNYNNYEDRWNILRLLLKKKKCKMEINKVTDCNVISFSQE